MENLYVSDLFGYNITSGSPVIIINVNKTKNIFFKLAEDLNNNTSIWKYNEQLINQLLVERNVNSNNFLIIGHILAKNNMLPDIIILANKNICKQPHGFEEIMNYNDGKIIRFYNESDSKKKIYSVGLFYVDNKINNIKSDMSSIGIINDKLLIDYLPDKNTKSSTQSDAFIDSNDFGLLSSPQLGIKTISRTYNTNKKIKLANNETDKYLTVLNDNVVTKQGLTSLAQVFSYNAQGELISDGKCLSYGESKVSAESCNSENLNQKWVLSQNKILPSNNFGKCLDVNALDKTTVKLNDCDSSYSQQWNTEIENNIFNDTESSNSGNYTWTKYKGKTLALVENDNPWFVNSDLVSQMSVDSSSTNRFDQAYFKEMPHYQPNYSINLRNNSVYKSDFVMDPESPTLGYGYSFKSRGGKPCAKIEHFEEEDKKSYTIEQQILAIIVLIALLLILYKIWKSSQDAN